MKNIVSSILFILYSNSLYAERIIRVDNGVVEIKENNIIIFSQEFDTSKDYSKWIKHPDPNIELSEGYKTIQKVNSVGNCLIINDWSWSEYDGNIVTVTSYDLNGKKIQTLKHDNSFSGGMYNIITNYNSTWGILLVTFEGDSRGYYLLKDNCEILANKFHTNIGPTYYFGYGYRNINNQIYIFGENTEGSFIKWAINKNGSFKESTINP